MDAWSYQGLSRLSDGIYMFSSASKALARVIADGAVIADPTPIVLSGVDRIVGGGINHVASQTGQWVFIAASGTGYKFVRHDGVSQQDIPFDVNLDISTSPGSTRPGGLPPGRCRNPTGRRRFR